MSPTDQARTFADHVVDYAQAGWPCIVPVPPETKTPPPGGFTGAEGRDTQPLDLVGWARTHARSSIALRMPDGVIGIDVDQYVKKGTPKHGAETLAAYLERWGPLPATWTSTARAPDGPSRIYFYRVPAQRYATRLATGGERPTGDVEIIQRHHRYAVVWPSPHEEVGTRYTWYDPSGAPSPRPPSPLELAELPATWVEGLAAGASTAAVASSDIASGQGLLNQLLEDWRPECAEITSARKTAVEQLSKVEAGSRHDTLTERTHHLIQLAASGHAGVARALLEVAQLWEQITVGEDRPGELERALVTTARKAVTAVGAVQVPNDPCAMMAGYAYALPPSSAQGLTPQLEGAVPNPLATDPGAGDPELQIVVPPRWVTNRQLLGTEAFDPNADLDQSLAEAVLERVWPVARFAYDSRNWLVRQPERWELHDRRLAESAVAWLAPMMPVGDSTAEKGSEPKARAARRARLMTQAGAKAVSGKIEALVGGGMHPAALALADLDADPEIMWAGGMPYDLRRSHDGPTFADLVGPDTPHLSTAAVRPEIRPTPLWDAFTTAVWPEPELRSWALRVMSIAFTGYADRALPILLGDTGRGKTQVIALLMSVLGGYAHAANPKLLSPSANAHDTIVFALKGRRLSFIDEAPRDNRSGQERLKQLSGGGELTANQMNQNPITFRPSHTLVLTANDEPVLTDPAVRSRTRLIPCIGDPEQVRDTRAAIGHVAGPAWRREAPGVLAAMMAEAAGWLADRSSADMTSAPADIRFLVETIGAEQDPIHQWLESEVEPSEQGTPSRELYQSFRASCLRSGIRIDQMPSETKWGRELTKRGYPSVHTESGKRRQLRVRLGGPMTGLTAPTPAEFLANPDGQPLHQTQQPTDRLTGSDGFLTGSETNPSGVKPQVTPNESVAPDGSDGFFTSHGSHAHARARAHEGDLQNGSTRQDPTDSLGVTCENALTGSMSEALDQLPLDLEADPEPKRARKTTEAATQKAAEKREAARLEAIATAGGGHVELPAVVTRDGTTITVSATEAEQLLAPALDELTVDVEHTGFPIGHRHYALRTVQLGNEAIALVLDPHDPDQADVVRRSTAAAQVLHAHSASADLIPLEVAGLLEHGIEEAWGRMHDTVIPAKLADPASTGSDPDLKKISAAVLGEHAVSPGAEAARVALFKAGKWLTKTVATTPLERSGWAQVDSRSTTMVRYAAADVLDDAAIARRLPAVPPVVLERERLAQRMVSRVAHHGLRIDGDHVLELLGLHQGERSAVAELVRAYGIENPGSNDQVAAALEGLGAALPRTATGKASVREAVLTPLSRTESAPGQLAKLVLEYRGHDTAIGTFLEPYLQLVAHGDGRARPTVYTLGADTGRMSCVRPNLQQVPREGGFRSCITADPGMVLVSADFAGVELRAAAALSGDRNLRAILEDPARDLHWEIARLAFGPTATKADRYAVKRGVFGRIYGGGVAAIAAGVGVNDATAQAIIDALDALLPELTDWSRMVREAVKAGHTQFPTYAGRIAHLDPAYPHKAPNYCIQGTARELLIDALVRWSDTRWGSDPTGVLLPVHDELVVVVPENDAQAATDELVRAMTTELNGVPIKAEASEPSYAWKDAS